jgi:branched-chain amino acid transport system permease protein
MFFLLRNMSIEFFLQLTINGLLLAAFYTAVTLGFSTIWGVMRLINLAHGEFLLMGAFTAWFFFNPQREQSLVIGSSDTTFLVIAVLSFGVGLLLAGSGLMRGHFARRWQRLFIGVAIASAVGLAGYLLWSSAGLDDIHITVLALVTVGLALTLGLLISRFVLRASVKNNVLRTLIGYGLGAGLVAAGVLLWQASGYSPIDPFLSLPLVFLLFFGVGYLLQKRLINRIIDGPYLTMLLVTFAISIILQNIGLAIYAADPRRINAEYGPAIPLIGNLTIPPNKLLMAIMSIVLAVGLSLFLRHTRIGYAIRAAAQNKMAARLMGINVKETYALTFGVSIALTAAAGAMMGTFQPITPVTGPPWTLRAFAIVALGGLGSVRGVVAGSLVLGLAETYIGGYADVGWAIAATFVILVITLIVRPQGIIGGLRPVEEV